MYRGVLCRKGVAGAECIGEETSELGSRARGRPRLLTPPESPPEVIPEASNRSRRETGSADAGPRPALREGNMRISESSSSLSVPKRLIEGGLWVETEGGGLTFLLVIAIPPSVPAESDFRLAEVL